MHSAEGAMFPIAKATLSFLDISNYWSRDIRPPASSNELLSILVSAWWLGELRGDSVSRLQLLKIMFTSKNRDDLGIVFIVSDDAGPPQVDLPDGSLEIDVRPQIRVPSSNTETWDEAACRDAFHALAQATEDFSIDVYREFAVLLPSTKLIYEEFDTWCRSRGYSTPTFWQRPHLAHRDHTGAAAGSDDGAPLLSRVAPRKETKAWRAKPRRHLTASEIAVVRAMNELSPDGRLDLRAKARDERIKSQLGRPVSPRTIQRTLKKIHYA
jgi:hypothetical protein